MSNDGKLFKASIYALTDIHDNIFYIGCTTGLITKRVKQHISSAKMKWKKSRKCEMIRLLGYKINIKELYRFGLYATDGKDAIQKSRPIEDRWIRKHKKMGIALCNGYKNQR